MGIAGILSSVIKPTNIALAMTGPAGWASIAMKTIGSAIGQQVIQQVGQKLGLPQSVVNAAQTVFSAASGTRGLPTTIGGAVQQLAKQFNLSPSQQGNLERQSNVLLERFTKAALEGKTSAEEAGSASEGKADSFLVAFAKALGKAMDAKMNRMMDVSKNIDKETKEANLSGGKRSAVVGEMSSELQALGQELSMISQAVANSVKSIGEASSTMARKG